MKTNLLILLSVLLFACKSHVKTLVAEDFYSEIQTNNGQVIDVRTPEEFKEGFIEGAVNINFNADNFTTQISNVPKDETIYLYCLKGVRSENAAKKLNSLGYKNIISLKGGIEAWQAAKLPLVMPENITKTNKPALKKYRTTEFDSIIKGKKLVFVDFNATWCGPCKAMQPYVDKIKDTREKEVTVLSIDTDANPELAARYKINQIPAIYLFKKGKTLYNEVGGKDEIALNELVDKYK